MLGCRTERMPTIHGRWDSKPPLQVWLFVYLEIRQTPLTTGVRVDWTISCTPHFHCLIVGSRGDGLELQIQLDFNWSHPHIPPRDPSRSGGHSSSSSRLIQALRKHLGPPHVGRLRILRQVMKQHAPHQAAIVPEVSAWGEAELGDPVRSRSSQSTLAPPGTTAVPWSVYGIWQSHGVYGIYRYTPYPRGPKTEQVAELAPDLPDSV